MGPAKPPVLLLPGMDGTGKLFGPFRAAIQGFCEPIVVSYPHDPEPTLEGLADHVAKQVPAEPYAVVAESFSGPIALTLATRDRGQLRGVVLSTSFVTSPMPRWTAALPLTTILRMQPKWVLSALPLGNILRELPPEVLAARMRLVLKLDAREALRSCKAPLVYFMGSRDSIVGDRGFLAIRKTRADVELVRIPGSHFLLQDNPAEAATALALHLESWFSS